jgi:hypothetical protein
MESVRQHQGSVPAAHEPRPPRHRCSAPGRHHQCDRRDPEPGLAAASVEVYRCRAHRRPVDVRGGRRLHRLHRRNTSAHRRSLRRARHGSPAGGDIGARTPSAYVFDVDNQLGVPRTAAVTAGSVPSPLRLAGALLGRRWRMDALVIPLRCAAGRRCPAARARTRRLHWPNSASTRGCAASSVTTDRGPARRTHHEGECRSRLLAGGARSRDRRHASRQHRVHRRLRRQERSCCRGGEEACRRQPLHMRSEWSSGCLAGQVSALHTSDTPAVRQATSGQQSAQPCCHMVAGRVGEASTRTYSLE